MVEDDKSSLDTAMYQMDYLTGQKHLLPVRLEQAGPSGPEPEPDLQEQYEELSMGADIQDNPESYVSSNPCVRHHSFYMKEFVARADVICQALLAREALPDENL